MSLANRCLICGEIKQNCDCDTNEIVEEFIEKLESEGKLINSDIAIIAKTLKEVLNENT